MHQSARAIGPSRVTSIEDVKGQNDDTSVGYEIRRTDQEHHTMSEYEQYLEKTAYANP
jgi:hypothetical protein